MSLPKSGWMRFRHPYYAWNCFQGGIVKEPEWYCSLKANKFIFAGEETNPENSYEYRKFVKKWKDDPEFRIKVLLEEDLKQTYDPLESHLGVRKSPTTDTASNTVRKRPRVKNDELPLFSPVLNKQPEQLLFSPVLNKQPEQLLFSPVLNNKIIPIESGEDNSVNNEDCQSNQSDPLMDIGGMYMNRSGLYRCLCGRIWDGNAQCFPCEVFTADDTELAILSRDHKEYILQDKRIERNMKKWKTIISLVVLYKQIKKRKNNKLI